MRRFLSVRAVGILAVGILAAGCGVSVPSASGGPSTTEGSPFPSPSTSPAGVYQVDPSPSDLALRLDSGGGLVPLSYFLDHVPQFSLYGDGRIVIPGPIDTIPTLKVGHVVPWSIAPGSTN